MTPDQIEALFTRIDGTYAFARWGRPIAPIVFGVTDEALSVIKGAWEAVAMLAGHTMAETDPQLGANVMMFFFHDWGELLEVPDLGRLIPNLDSMVAQLQSADANQYRIFRFDDTGAIQACFIFLRMDRVLSKQPAETLALSQVVQSFLLWSDHAFQSESPLALAGERTVLRPDIANVIRAAYDPVMPATANDPSHALRLSARISKHH